MSRRADLESEDLHQGEGSLPVELLSDLFPGQEALLFHLLVCDACRDRASATLLARHGVRLVLPVGSLGALLAEPCGGELRRELAAEGLLAELMTHPRESQWELLEEERYQVPELVDLLLVSSRSRQLDDPEMSEALARLAARLAVLTLGEEADEDLARVHTRAGVLMANARRLSGRPEEASALLGRTVFCSAPRVERARYFRTLGLVRWEEGRLEEGAAHLQDAVRLFSEARRLAEEGEALALLGLLLAETGQVAPCIGALLSGLPLLVAEQQPWLATRGCLTLAGALAAAGCPDEAQALLRKGREQAADVEEPSEAELLQALEGRVLGNLEEREPARELLQAARAGFLDKAQLPDAALASLDLALVLAELGRAAEIAPLAAELEERFGTSRSVGETVTALRAQWTEGAGLRRNVESAATALRRLFRTHGPRPRPLPFV